MREPTQLPAFDPTRPYNALPALPPKVDIESRAILKACIEARAALAALKHAGSLLPNQAVLINTVPLMEAQASSEIENIVTTADTLFKQAQLDERTADPATKEALRYRTALRRGVELLKRRPLSSAVAVEVCSTLMGREMNVRKVPGTVLTNSATGAVVYTPPVGEALLREKLANWEKFIHEQGTIDPLIRMAVAHYQFEAIHPFLDGNGRTGRVLNELMLIEQGLLELPVLYLSRYITRNRADYYRLLLAVTRESVWEEWIVYVLRGVSQTATWTTEKIAALRALMSAAADHIRAELPKLYSHELVELVFMQPYCRIQNLVATGIAKRQTASVYLKSLVEIGVLREVEAGREKLFLHPKFLDLLLSDTHTFTPYAMRGPRAVRGHTTPARRPAKKAGRGSTRKP
jgi:Fic family protein